MPKRGAEPELSNRVSYSWPDLPPHEQAILARATRAALERKKAWLEEELRWVNEELSR